MARVRRKAAAEMIGRLSDRLSDDLIGDEDEAKASMEAVFVGAISVVAEYLDGLRQVTDVDETVAAITLAAERAVIATAGPFRVLLDAAVHKGLLSVRTELQAVEETLGIKYQGLSAASVTRVSRNTDEMLNVVAAQYLTGMTPHVQWWRTQLDTELRVSLADREDAQQRLQRLMAPGPIRPVLREHTGRGLWWKVLEQCNRVSRECEFAAVNSARTEAMIQFNTIGEERG